MVEAEKAPRLLQIATETAALRREPTVEVLLLVPAEDAADVLTAEEIREVWVEAVSQERAADHGHGIFTLTEAGRPSNCRVPQRVELET